MDPTRDRLLAERDRTRRRLAELTGDFRAIVEASQATNADDEHDPEGATIGFERAQATTLLAEARTHLAELERAADDLAAGRYGRCRSCGRPIGVDRLLARPTAARCIRCATRPPHE